MIGFLAPRACTAQWRSVSLGNSRSLLQSPAGAYQSWFHIYSIGERRTSCCRAVCKARPRFQPERSVRAVSQVRNALCQLTMMPPVQTGAWCSGITSASHAEGLGCKSQCAHLSKPSRAVPSGCHSMPCPGPKKRQHNTQLSENKFAPSAKTCDWNSQEQADGHMV